MGISHKPTPWISVIVPAHNAESTLSKCLRSILLQSYKNLEIIVVVDACIDATERIARVFEGCDSRVRVVVTDGCGASHARNVGLDFATGDYVGFVDSDDWVDRVMFASMLQVALKNNADIVCCGWVVDLGESSTCSPVGDCEAEIGADDFYYGVLMGPYCGFVWNKLFSRRAILEKSFDESISIIEDSAFCCSLASDDLSFFIMPGCFYHYTVSQQSATHDLSKLVTADGKWAYLEGAQVIRARAATESQRRISDETSCTFAASGVRELAGKAEYRDLYKELKCYLRTHLLGYMKVEPDKAKKVKTLFALFAPGLWGFAKERRQGKR